MYDDFLELKIVNSWLLDRVTARFPCGVRQYTMVEFNDPTVGPVRKTESKKEFSDFFNNLVANGGGDCPELAMHGLELALENSPPNSFILVLTDASALDYWDTALVNHIYSLIESTKSQMTAAVSGFAMWSFFGSLRHAPTPSTAIRWTSTDDVSTAAHSADIAVNISSAGGCSECHPNAKCEEYFGFMECNCMDGFIGDGFTCSDIDECAYSWSNNCSYGICHNTFGSYTCLCPSGYTTSSDGTCADINECASPELNSCHSSASCINYNGYYYCVCLSGYFGNGFQCEIDECTYGACGLGIECTKSLGTYNCSDPCSYHTVLNEPWRSTSNKYGYRYNCDSTKVGWYRFVGSGGVRMPESCASEYSCDTAASIWLSGTHPMLSDSIVNRTVCASWGGSCCLWSSTVQIKACPGGYHVYKMDGTPYNICSLSYCTDPTSVDSLTCAADEEWKLSDGSYGCYCKDKYEVADIADLRPELTCDVYNMKAAFHKCQLKSLNLNASSITLKDSSCFGFHEDPSSNTFTIMSPLQAGRCGLLITTNGTHAIYENTLYFAIESTGLIVRNEELAVIMSCAYVLDMMISLNIAVNPIFSSTNISVGGTGQFTANMALYQDSSYVTPYEGSAVVLSSKSLLYVGVFVQGGDSSQYVVIMKNCYATPTSNPYDAVKYYIVKDSCPNKQDSTISVLENGVSRKGRLSLQVFKFVGNYNSVYIHCAVSLCDVTAGSCSPSCSGIGSRSAGAEESYQLSVGPIVRQDKVSIALSSGCIGTGESSALLGFVFLLMTQTLFL
ncbi:uromodulin-like [Rhinoderma darwinii]|uniref:uromodulin-like n=1 Tax=Rhinoderma darwinii TaxID=43563 RepID=UPI003F67B219